MQDYEIPNQAADWFYKLINNFLFIDTGTGPPPRSMTVYDLNKRQPIFSTEYNIPVTIDNNHYFLGKWRAWDSH